MSKATVIPAVYGFNLLNYFPAFLNPQRERVFPLRFTQVIKHSLHLVSYGASQ